jgi:hypothetical protein
MRLFFTIMAICLAIPAFGQQKRVNGVTVVSEASGQAKDLRVMGLALSNVVGTASSSLLTNVTLNTNASIWTFSSAAGLNLTCTLPTNTVVTDGSVFEIVLGSEGTNFLNITPTSFALGTADKIHRSTNFIITPGMALTLQQVGTNWNIIRGQPNVPIGGYMDWHPNFAGVCATPSSFFVACNGQVLADAGSPMNGATIPNWNNQQFARYNTTSGGTGGSATHAHTASLSIEVLPTGGGGGFAWDANASSSADGSEPPYIDAVRLIRVK